jgi:hypothetical protein
MTTCEALAKSLNLSGCSLFCKLKRLPGLVDETKDPFHLWFLMVSNSTDKEEGGLGSSLCILASSCTSIVRDNMIHALSCPGT